MHVYIFYNGTDFYAPGNNRWQDFTFPNNPRLFLATALSWKANGWIVKRVTTNNVLKGFNLFHRPEMCRDLPIYSAGMWNLWLALNALPKNEYPICVANMNIFNRCFRPDNAQEFINAPMHVNGWCNACMCLSKEAVAGIIKAIETYIYTTLPLPVTELLTDEVLIREYFKHLDFARANKANPCGFSFDKPLVHLSRSMITRNLDFFEAI